MIKEKNFCACAFINKMFIFGGYYNGDYSDNSSITNTCLQFDVSNKSLIKIAEIKMPRIYAACVVFDGNIIVSGGYDNNRVRLNTVELYDVFAKKWSPFPSMIKSKLFL